MEEQKTDEIHPKETKVVKNAHPKETKVVKNAPPKHDIMDDPDDITQQLLAETQNAKQMFNQQEVAKKDNQEKHK